MWSLDGGDEGLRFRPELLTMKERGGPRLKPPPRSPCRPLFVTEGKAVAKGRASGCSHEAAALAEGQKSAFRASEQNFDQQEGNLLERKQSSLLLCSPIEVKYGAA